MVCSGVVHVLAASYSRIETVYCVVEDDSVHRAREVLYVLSNMLGV
jgi:hypothetical protein